MSFSPNAVRSSRVTRRPANSEIERQRVVAERIGCRRRSGGSARRARRRSSARRRPAATMAPMLVPPTWSIGTPEARSALTTPIWVKARAPPPAMTTPTAWPVSSRASRSKSDGCRAGHDGAGRRGRRPAWAAVEPGLRIVALVQQHQLAAAMEHRARSAPPRSRTAAWSAGRRRRCAPRPGSRPGAGRARSIRRRRRVGAIEHEGRFHLAAREPFRILVQRIRARASGPGCRCGRARRPAARRSAPTARPARLGRMAKVRGWRRRLVGPMALRTATLRISAGSTSG